ncbi:NAD(P)-binding protein [Myriangium duriaei CBS 260.36]|uniref:D-arabinitol 2-dehydrogenase [ribulose-forming] n=1 Tax=Myriangium duriaei CBS 260.36 TaxID=1168546 RepID=A0A9P4IWX0_9PEZI|nr:NAD(P)-binding protein [Myriangium duriaei CBS 260.36]
MSDRASLASRQLPVMTLSNGAATSLTAPPKPLPSTLSAAERAQARFGVTGNAIITGGAGTLALSAARALFEHGLQGIAIFDLQSTLDTSSTAIDALKADFPAANIITLTVDVTDAVAVDQAVEDCTSKLSSINTLLCFAGIVGCVHAMDMTPEQWRKTLDVNTTGSFFCAQAVAKRMAAQGTGGSIMLTASISGHRVNYPQPQVSYNVSKAAIVAMKNSLAAEWSGHGIRVNCISPGYMDTVLNEGPGLEQARNTWASRCPMGRMGAIGELDGAIVLLCSRAGSYMTGADIVIDGGSIVF